MTNLVCKLRGHRWQELYSGHLKKGAPIYVCLRCKENGWLLP